MLKQILDDARLESAFCASLLGVAPQQFEGWLEGREPIPHFVMPELSSIIGISPSAIRDKGSASLLEGSRAPAIWYKLRDEKLNRADREMVGLVRKLGFYSHQLQEVVGGSITGHEQLLSAVRKRVDRAAPAEIQATVAAQAVRSAADFGKGQTGIGELIRPYLRRMGLLLLESPLRGSALEGCSFVVGPEEVDTPCIFVNSYKATWFRRNAAIMHEFSHVVFDIQDEQVCVDYKDDNDSTAFREVRAQLFARECLVPSPVLNHFTNQFGIDWDALTEQDLARLVAHIHVEAKLILEAAFAGGFIGYEQLVKYRGLNCQSHLLKISRHALSTDEYFKSLAKESPKWKPEFRNTDIATRSLRLPSGYVNSVIEACNSGQISVGKAAEMLMMERRTFEGRFDALLEVCEWV